ncbi:AI-2E family transporter [candidate division KSB1 bacterium]
MSLISEKPFTFDRVVRIGITIAIIWGIIWLLGILSDVLIPFAVAAILAYLIHPLVNFIRFKLRVKYNVPSVIISLILVFGFLTLIGILIIPLIFHEIKYMGELLTKLVNDTDWNKQAANYLPNNIIKFIEDFIAREDVQAFFNTESFGKLTSNALQKILPGIWNFFSGALNVIVGVFGVAIIILYLVFLLIDYNTIFTGWKELIPPAIKTQTLDLINNFNNAMHNYFRAQALIAGIVGVLFAIGFWIIGLPMGIFLGIFIGLLNMVPYLQTIAIIPAGFLALMYALETGNDFWGFIGLIAIIFIVVQAIQDYFLTPRIMGKAMSLNAAFILLSLSVWGKLLGLLGLLIALPMTYLIFAYYKQFIRKAEEKKTIGFKPQLE